MNPSFQKRKLAEHIESYVTLVKNKCLTSAAFRKFWQDYPQTSSKNLTIKIGEIGFSKAMVKAGFKIGALSRRRFFIEEIDKRSDAFLEKTLKYAAYSDEYLQNAGLAVLVKERDSNWRHAALDHIHEVVERRRFNASFCWATEQIVATTFIKKHPGRIFQIGRLRFLEAVEGDDIICDNKAALLELRAQIDRDFGMGKP